MKVKAWSFIAGVLLAGGPLVSSAASLPAPFEGISILQADGVVKSINPTQHTLTVLDARGGEASFTVTDAHDLAKISPGGKVQIRMTRNAVVRVTHVENDQDMVAQATPPDTHDSVSAEVQTVDRASGIVGLKRGNGAVFHIQGREPAKVAELSPGMLVSVVFAPQASVAVAPTQ